MATKAPERFGKLVLVAPVGVKTGRRTSSTFPTSSPCRRRTWSGSVPRPQKGRLDRRALTTRAHVIARNRETLALLVWEPWMHNPKLKHRLHRLTMPTLFLRGESDGLLRRTISTRYAKLVPNARIETIAKAGHAPQVEQPEAFAQKSWFPRR